MVLNRFWQYILTYFKRRVSWHSNIRLTATDIFLCSTNWRQKQQLLEDRSSWRRRLSFSKRINRRTGLFFLPTLSCSVERRGMFYGKSIFLSTFSFRKSNESFPHFFMRKARKSKKEIRKKQKPCGLSLVKKTKAPDKKVAVWFHQKKLPKSEKNVFLKILFSPLKTLNVWKKQDVLKKERSFR